MSVLPADNAALALTLADAGLPVFPCHAGGGRLKQPLVSGGFRAATTEKTQISEWWNTWPTALPAIRTGSESGLAVIDVDVDRETGETIGQDALDALNLPVEGAVLVHTPSGGAHLYFRHVEGAKCSASKIANKVDVRADGGYVIAPGAVLEDGRRYQHEGRSLFEALRAGDLSDFPLAQVNAAVEARKAGVNVNIAAVHIDCPDGANAWAEAALGGEIAELRSTLPGARNDALNRAAFSLGQIVGGGHLDRERVVSELTQAGKAIGLEDRETARTIESGLKSGFETPRGPKDGQPLAVANETPQEPRSLLHEDVPGAAYPTEHLGPLRDAVEEVQASTLAPVAIPAASALSVAALAVQGFANVETLGGPRPVSIFALTIARSGERKSSCDARFMAALREYEREQARSQREENTRHKNEHALWKGDRDSILGEAKKAKGVNHTAAQADLAALGPEPTAPPSPDRVVTEPTFEGLTKLFAIGQPSLGIFSDEGGQFLGGYAMNVDNRQKTQAALNDLWQGNPIRRTRAGDGHATLHGRRLSIHLMVQPRVAYNFIVEPLAAETGFLPRFLICEPPSTIGTRFHANCQSDVVFVDAFARRLHDILQTPMPMDEETRELTPRVLPLAPEAKTQLIDFADELERAQAPGGDLAHVTGYASKAAEHAARIAAVLCLWRDLDAQSVTGADMADGIALARYYLSEAVRLTDAAVASREFDRARKLLRWLQKDWAQPEITVRDVHRYGPNELRKSAIARSALTMLEQYGWLEKLPAGSVVDGAARNEAWRIVRAPKDGS